MKKKDRVEVMCMFGVFGMLVCASGMYPLVIRTLFSAKIMSCR